MAPLLWVFPSIWHTIAACNVHLQPAAVLPKSPVMTACRSFNKFVYFFLVLVMTPVSWFITFRPGTFLPAQEHPSSKHSRCYSHSSHPQSPPGSIQPQPQWHTDREDVPGADQHTCSSCGLESPGRTLNYWWTLLYWFQGTICVQ